MDQNIISDFIFDKLSLMDIRALKSTNKQNLNIPINGIFINAIKYDLDNRLNQLYNYMDTRDPAEAIPYTPAYQIRHLSQN